MHTFFLLFPLKHTKLFKDNIWGFIFYIPVLHITTITKKGENYTILVQFLYFKRSKYVFEVYWKTLNMHTIILKVTTKNNVNFKTQ